MSGPSRRGSGLCRPAGIFCLFRARFAALMLVMFFPCRVCFLHVKPGSSGGGGAAFGPPAGASLGPRSWGFAPTPRCPCRSLPPWVGPVWEGSSSRLAPRLLQPSTAFNFLAPARFMIIYFFVCFLPFSFLILCTVIHERLGESSRVKGRKLSPLPKTLTKLLRYPDLWHFWARSLPCHCPGSRLRPTRLCPARPRGTVCAPAPAPALVKASSIPEIASFSQNVLIIIFLIEKKVKM